MEARQRYPKHNIREIQITTENPSQRYKSK